MKFYAHTFKLPDGKTTNPDTSNWEPLFTSFGPGKNECQRDSCKACSDLEPQHGHLNKVAYHTAQFAAEMFPENSKESKLAHQWGYLTGLWHDLGKLAPEWQERATNSRNFEGTLTLSHRLIQLLDRSYKRLFQMHPLIARIRKTIQYRNHLLIQTAAVLPRPLLQSCMQIIREISYRQCWHSCKMPA